MPFDVIAAVVPFVPGESLQVVLVDPSVGLEYDMCTEAGTGHTYAAVREPGTEKGC